MNRHDHGVVCPHKSSYKVIEKCTYDDIHLISEILFSNGYLDDNGLLRLQEAELYIKDRLAQERAKQVRESIPHAHQTTALEIIVEMKLSGPKGTIEEPVLVEAMANHMGYPFMRLESLELDPDFVTRVLPQKFSDRFLIIPLQETNGKLKISIYDPSQREVLEDVSRVSGRELEIVISPKTDIMKIILEFHGFRGSIKAAAEKHVKYFRNCPTLSVLPKSRALKKSPTRIRTSGPPWTPCFGDPCHSGPATFTSSRSEPRP